MNKKILAFGDINFEKDKFYYSKYPININILDIDIA